MNRGADKSAKSAPRSQKQLKTQQPKKRGQKDAQSGCKDAQCDPSEPPKEVKAAQRAGKVSSSAESQPGPTGAHRKLSDASNTSEDLSKDSGCLSGKVSSSDCSSEISDCPSEGNRHDSPCSDNDLSWIDGKADLSRGGEDAAEGQKSAKSARDAAAALLVDAAKEGPSPFNSSGAFIDIMMGNTAEDLVREVDELRSENEYLKDEVEELRCEMLEMRDMFQEEEVYQLQELRLQLEQANKTCRILHYRLRKAERRSIRVAQTGQVDGELVKSLEHDIKVAKSVSRRLYSELEVVQKRSAQLEWDNEGLREKTQELEVARQVLQTELEKARENNQRRRSIRSTASKAEKRLSQQMEDDSADLKCQLHFAKEELALMCKKLTKVVSESEATREELSRYHAAYGHLDAAQSPEGKRKSSRHREAEVRAHLKLVEEEATLLSRRIVELEVENRGLRAEMSDLREKVGGGGGGGEEEDEENQDVSEENQAAAVNTKVRERGVKVGQGEQGRGREDVETSSICSRSQTEGMMGTCHITREGPIGGEWDPSDSREGAHDSTSDRGVKGMTGKDYEALLALRDHSCILSSALQLLMKNSHSSPRTDGKGPEVLLSEALELLQSMLQAFICRLDALFTSQDLHKASVHRDERAPDLSCLSVTRDAHAVPESQQESPVDLRVKEATQKAKPTRDPPVVHPDLLSGCRDPKMQLSLQILWILHQWCQVKGADTESREDQTVALELRDVLQELSLELGDDRIQCDRRAGVAPGDAAERPLGDVLHAGGPGQASRICSSAGGRARRQLSPRGVKSRKNWCYLSHEAAQLDQEDPVKTWDHLIMPLSFPDLDFDQMLMERSHTAPVKSVSRIYYSPPSARRVQLAQQKQNVESDSESAGTPASWCTPLTSFSQLCLGSSANLSDDMKEMTAGWRPAAHDGPQEKAGRAAGGWVEAAGSEAQTLVRPRMVSVGQQTDATQSSMGVRSSPSRVLSPPLASARTHHISSSLDGITGRVERTRSSASSPKLYRRHSASAVSSIPSSANLSSSSSTSSSGSTSRDRALWSPSHQTQSGPAWSRQNSPRAGGNQNHGSLSGAKPPGKSAGANRYGLVTEFLRRVSGRVDKQAPPGSGQKGKNVKNLERVPSRPPAVPLHRNDSVTRIVNQRFMKQREEAGRGQREEKGSSRQSLSTSTAEDGNYDCSSSGTLTFCFARPSRSAQRPASSLAKLQRHRHSPAVSTAADSHCD